MLNCSIDWLLMGKGTDSVNKEEGDPQLPAELPEKNRIVPDLGTEHRSLYHAIVHVFETWIEKEKIKIDGGQRANLYGKLFDLFRKLKF